MLQTRVSMETTREFERNRELASQLSLNFVLYIISISGCFGVPVCVCRDADIETGEESTNIDWGCCFS